MVDLSRAVGADTIAEQIETEAVANVMRDMGVRYGQGWVFDRPGPLPGKRSGGDTIWPEALVRSALGSNRA